MKGTNLIISLMAILILSLSVSAQTNMTHNLAYNVDGTMLYINCSSLVNYDGADPIGIISGVFMYNNTANTTSGADSMYMTQNVVPNYGLCYSESCDIVSDNATTAVLGYNYCNQYIICEYYIENLSDGVTYYYDSIHVTCSSTTTTTTTTSTSISTSTSSSTSSTGGTGTSTTGGTPITTVTYNYVPTPTGQGGNMPGLNNSAMSGTILGLSKPTFFILLSCLLVIIVMTSIKPVPLGIGISCVAMCILVYIIQWFTLPGSLIMAVCALGAIYFLSKT